MKFEWDINKAALNIKNHDVSFDEAEEVFFDKFVLDVYDDSHSDLTEQRFQVLGLTTKRILLVVYTVRFEEIYRIISARKATKSEVDSYWKERNMSEGILMVTEEDYEEMKANGITDESLLKPGKYKLRRRTKTATREELHPSNTKVEFQMKLDLDVLRHFQKNAENGEVESLQLALNEKLRAVMEDELKLAEVENKLLNDKKFIAALAEEVKKAA